MKKIILILILIGTIVGITYAVTPRQAESPSNGAQQQEIAAIEPTVNPDYIKYGGEEGKTAFELLQGLTEVEYQQYDFGIFVESINSVRPDEQHFWKLYINGQDAQVGADQLQTRNSDVLEWKLEEISNNY